MTPTCSICQQPIQGQPVYIGCGTWQHQMCCPGSIKWMAYFRKLKPSQRTEAGQLIYNNAKAKLKKKGSRKCKTTSKK